MKAITPIFLLLMVVCAPLGLHAQETGAPQGPAGTTPAAATPSSTNIDMQGIRNYLLGPGDTISVRVFGQPDFNWDGEVDSQGNITIFFIDTPIKAQCRSERDLQKAITTAYSKYLRNPQVSVRITGHNSRPPAIIHGAVYAPQRIQMMRSVHLNELLAYAGGVSERSNGIIEVLHTEEPMCPQPGEVIDSQPLHYYKVADLLAGNPTSNPAIRPGDVVRAMEASPIYIVGEVRSPQGIYLRDQMTLTRAIAMVGGATANADLSKVVIHRQKPGDAEPQRIRINFSAIKRGQQPDVHLQPYDIVEVGHESEWSGPGILKMFFHSVVPASLSTFGQTLPMRVIY